MKNAEIFAHLGNRYVTAKAVISVRQEVQKEYIAYHENFTVEEYTEEDCLKKSDALLGQRISDEESRELLFALAHIATLPCIKLLEQYVTISSLGELKEWAMMGFEEAWLHHINEEMGDKRTLMMTGAGGEGNMLRYYIIVSCSQNLTEKQTLAISDAYDDVAAELDVEVENIEYGENYALITLLVSFDIALADPIERSVERANRNEVFLRYHYYATNTAKPTQDLIDKYLGEIISEEK